MVVSNPHAIEIPGGGTWWDAGHGNHLWVGNGGTGLPPAESYDEAVASVARSNAGEFYCAGCKTWHAKPHAFRRFAGLYCEAAAEEHKAANSRACRLCGRPIWDCYC